MQMESNRVIAVIVLIAGSCTLGEAQELAARYYPEKAANPLGEAVFVLVELTNISSRTVQFDMDPVHSGSILLFQLSNEALTSSTDAREEEREAPASAVSSS